MRTGTSCIPGRTYHQYILTVCIFHRRFQQIVRGCRSKTHIDYPGPMRYSVFDSPCCIRGIYTIFGLTTDSHQFHAIRCKTCNPNSIIGCGANNSRYMCTMTTSSQIRSYLIKIRIDRTNAQLLIDCSLQIRMRYVKSCVHNGNPDLCIWNILCIFPDRIHMHLLQIPLCISIGIVNH